MSYSSKARSSEGAKVERTPTTVLPLAHPNEGARRWSPQQGAIFNWFEAGDGNLIVRARAGTGKTTTIIEGVKRAPEPTILMAAFNKRIAEELSARIPSNNVEAKTLHSIGFMIVREYWSGVRIARDTRDRELGLARETCGKDVPETIIKLVGKLHTKAREINPLAKDGEALLPLAEQFECEPEAFWHHQGFGLQFICESAYEAMQLAAEERPKTGIDFADMIYLPLKKNWAIGKFDMVVVDEAQDMTIAQLDLARKVLIEGGRMCVVGDDRQAIYGFRGADSSSIDRLKKELSAKELGLTVTYRCGHSIVKRAQEIVPDIEPHRDSPVGSIIATDVDKLIDLAKPGDFILSRLNAPLAGVCMQLIREGKRAEIAGRDIAAGLKSLMRKVGKGAKSVDDFIANLQAWETREVARLLALKFETRVQMIQDQAETLQVLCEGAETVAEVEKRLDTIFSDDGPNTQRILCSSVHKAKGLEADRVFLLDWTFRGGKHKEEDNICYVAVTRAKSLLCYVAQGRQ